VEICARVFGANLIFFCAVEICARVFGANLIFSVS
jgi:hypothetical protein